eukprot:augustus_masked-scaffold_44-processed-gene-1.112-mRNA-1 protein AED:1.00 eAED:1.00 QI:0/0/0/0/1/1/4/0/470
MNQSDSENVQSKNKEVESTTSPEQEEPGTGAGDEASSTQSNNPDTPNPTTEFTTPSQTPKRADTRSRSASVLPFSALDELNRIHKEKLAQKEAELDIREKGSELLLPKQQAAQDHNLKQLENLRSWHDKLVAKEMELSTLEDNLRQDIDEMEERKRRKEESELHDIPTGSNEEVRSSLKFHIVPCHYTISGQKPVAHFWKKDKYKALSGDPGYQTLPQAPVTYGLPFVQVQLPEKLRQLTRDKIENFLHDYRNTVRNMPSLSIQSLITKDVSDSLEQRGVNIASSEAILNYLTRHLINFEKAKRLRCLGILEKNLKWPSANLIPAEQIYLFFDQVSKILKHLDKEELKTHKKKILRSSGDFMQVKGLADTGANLNVAGLSSMQAYKTREEKPQFIKNVTFMDKKHIPVKAVVIAHVVLVQDGWKLDLKEQRFFCVDSELWDEMIIGDRTLRYFGVKLNIKDAQKTVHMDK